MRKRTTKKKNRHTNRYAQAQYQSTHTETHIQKALRSYTLKRTNIKHETSHHHHRFGFCAELCFFFVSLLYFVALLFFAPIAIESIRLHDHYDDVDCLEPRDDGLRVHNQFMMHQRMPFNTSSRCISYRSIFCSPIFRGFFFSDQFSLQHLEISQSA